ncbi:MAG: HAD-IC family P-type ATPase [Myxococcales bacterium]|nr:HAD-IC family P-type ATPase [Myxococcales bacterium]
MANALLHAPERDDVEDSGPASSVEAVRSRCPGCSAAVDPLRAGHVAIFEGRFWYFCQSNCKQAYLRAQGRPLEEGVETQRPPVVAARSASREVEPRAEEATSVPAAIAWSRTAPSVDDPSAESGSRSARSEEGDAPAVVPAPAPDPAQTATSSLLFHWRSRLIGLLDCVGITAGALVPGMSLVGPEAAAFRAPLMVASLAALTLRVALVPRDEADPHPLVVLAPVFGAVASALAAAHLRHPASAALAVFAGLSSATALAVEVLVSRARVRVGEARARIQESLDVRVRTADREEDAEVPVAEVRPGEQVIVEAGEVVGVDGTVVAGEARVVPWLGAPGELVRREGDTVLAGARVLSDRLRLTTTWSGRDRAWVKLLAGAASRIDVAAPTPRLVRRTVERGAPLAAVLVGVAALAANWTPVEILAAMCAGAMAFAAKSACSTVALHFARAHLEGLTCGIVYKDARSFERAASTRVAVLSARGTVLRGEPEIVAIESVGSVDAERVLALAAGAETASSHPFAAAVLRAARERGVRPDPVRNGALYAGLGVTAVASTGEILVVGGRSIMLRQKIGVAMADARVSDLEAQGCSVLLIALGDRLIGLIALQDGLRSGARAAVQRLLDARIEPVLLSGDARDTCETIARALDIEHVRPEVLPGDRGAEVRSLADGGDLVAVIGHPAGDDGALGAADVAVAMGAAGSSPGEWAVVLASEDVRDAAQALAIPHSARERARITVVLGAAPAVLALLAIAFGIAPLAVAPLGVLLGAVAAAAHAREPVVVA